MNKQDLFVRALPIKAILCSIALALTACTATLPTQENYTRIDNLIEQNNLIKANTLLSKIKTHESNDAQIKQHQASSLKLKKKVTKAEQETYNEASTLVKNAKHKEALDVLTLARNTFPQSDRLKHLEQNIQTQLAKRIKKLQTQIYLLQGKQIAYSNSLREEIGQLSSSNFQRRKNQPSKLWRFGSKRKISQQLLTCGKEALKDKNKVLAEDCLTTAKDLNNSEEIEILLAEVDTIPNRKTPRKIAKAPSQKPKAISSKVNDDSDDLNEVEILKEIYIASITQERWADAKGAINELLEIQPENDEFDNWSNELNMLINNNTNQAIVVGQTLYTDGDVSQALAVWKSAIKLDPNNTELQTRIARAERFLKNFNRLEQKSASND